MVEKKFSKEEWFKLTKQEQDFYTLEFNKSVEKRKRIVVFITRFIAIFFIFGLFYIGYVQLEAAKEINKIMDTYGSMGYCYLCGEKTLKRCECQFNFNSFEDFNLTEIRLNTALYNSESCKGKIIYTNRSHSINFNLSNQ